jgi:hypothetical protein
MGWLRGKILRTYYIQYIDKARGAGMAKGKRVKEKGQGNWR